jgi:hypothetical protein
LLKDFETHLGLDLAGLRDAVLLKRGGISPGPKEVPRLMDRYMESLAHLVTAVEQRLEQR